MALWWLALLPQSRKALSQNPPFFFLFFLCSFSFFLLEKRQLINVKHLINPPLMVYNTGCFFFIHIVRLEVRGDHFA